MQQGESGGFVYSPRLRLDDAVLNLVAHAKAVTSTDRIGFKYQLDMIVKCLAVDLGRPAVLKGDGDILVCDIDRLIPMGDSHDWRNNLHSRGEFF